MRMVRRADRDDIVRQGIQSLKHGVHHPLQFAELMAIISDFGDCIDLVEEKHCISRGHKLEDHGYSWLFHQGERKSASPDAKCKRAGRGSGDMTC